MRSKTSVRDHMGDDVRILIYRPKDRATILCCHWLAYSCSFRGWALADHPSVQIGCTRSCPMKLCKSRIQSSTFVVCFQGRFSHLFSLKEQGLSSPKLCHLLQYQSASCLSPVIDLCLFSGMVPRPILATAERSRCSSCFIC